MLAQGIAQGMAASGTLQDRRSLARAITLIEAGHPAAHGLLERLPVRRRHAPGAPHVLGLTGPPGAGKSSFVDRLVQHARAKGERVAVVAVDPSSPFSGGAILGDRIRMDRHAGDPGVYLRSLSARGAAGGLCRAAGQIVDLLDAAGFDRIIVETVGVGQGELAIMEVVDTVLVVLTPESGDTVQTMKAGLLEIADVFCVNKADRPGADALCRELELAVHLDSGPSPHADPSADPHADPHAPPRWAAPVHRSVATQDQGTDAVLASVAAHAAWCADAGLPRWLARRADARLSRCLELIAERAKIEARAYLSRPVASPGHPSALDAIRAGTLSPEAAAARFSLTAPAALSDAPPAPDRA